VFLSECFRVFSSVFECFRVFSSVFRVGLSGLSLCLARRARSPAALDHPKGLTVASRAAARLDDHPKGLFL